ncbi:MAG: peptidylprolyl isomerase [Candidatus Binatia bacterium]
MSRGTLAATMLLALGIAPGAARAEVVNRVIATIDGEPITAHEFERFTTERVEANVPRDKLLDALITEKLLDREASAQGITARPEDVDSYVKSMKARSRVDDARFEEAIRAQGLTPDEYRARVKSELERTQLVNREIRARVTISNEDVERYYDAHLGDYVQSERITVRDVFFAVPPGADAAAAAHVRAKAEEVRDLAIKGTRFDDLARQFSEGPGADKGGLLGTFARGEMAKPLEEVAFNLKPGDVSPVVETPRGLHILRVDERTGEGHRPVADVREEIREKLYGDALESRFEDWLTRDLRERHHVEVLDQAR